MSVLDPISAIGSGKTQRAGSSVLSTSQNQPQDYMKKLLEKHGDVFSAAAAHSNAQQAASYVH